MGRPLNSMQTKLLALIEQAADAGEAAPSNSKIADTLDLPHHSAASDQVRRLAKLGHIEIKPFGNRRHIRIVASGKSTGNRMPARIPSAQAVTTSFRGDVPEAQRVDRDPCFRCGARGDVGCVHRSVALSLCCSL